MNLQTIVEFKDQVNFYCFWSVNYVFEQKKAQILNLVISYSYLMFCKNSSQSGQWFYNYQCFSNLQARNLQ